MGRGGRRARQRSIAKRKALGPVRLAGCFEPDKRRYRTRTEAVHDAARIAWDEGRLLRPYPCGRHFHLTSRP